MKFVQCQIEELGKLRKYANNHEILSEFIKSNVTAARVEEMPHRDAKSCYTSLINSVRRYKFNQIQVRKRGDKIYLVRKDI